MTCTLADCQEESTLYLCEEHRLELADLIVGVDFLIANLDPHVQATKVTRRPGTNEGGNSTNKAGSKPPTIDTTQLRYWLWELPRNAYNEARNNSQAGHTLFMARIWVPRARNLVYGAEPETIDHDAIRTQVENIAPPMPTRQLLPWLKENAGIIIKRADINNWRQRGHLHPAQLDPSPAYRPHDVLDLWHRRGVGN